MKRLAVALAAIALLVSVAPASAAWLSKAVARVATEHSVYRAFHQRLGDAFTGWEVEPASSCERRSRTRVDCGWDLFTVERTTCPGTAHVHLVGKGVWTRLTFDLPEPEVCE